jgi:hypothetical protein
MTLFFTDNGQLIAQDDLMSADWNISLDWTNNEQPMDIDHADASELVFFSYHFNQSPGIWGK